MWTWKIGAFGSGGACSGSAASFSSSRQRASIQTETCGCQTYAYRACCATPHCSLKSECSPARSGSRTGLCFTSQFGTPLDGPNVTHQFQKLLQVSGLPKMRFHDLRHCAAVLLISQGVHPRTVMEILGHSQIAITMNLYGHILPELHDEAADKMDALFSTPTKISHQAVSDEGCLMRKLLILSGGPTRT